MSRGVRSISLASLLLLTATLSADEPSLNDKFPVDERNLSPPIVGKPIHECAKVVHVSGFIPHAIVRVYANVIDEVGKKNPYFGEDDIQLTRALKFGEKITATQTVGSVTSLQSYDPVPVGHYPTSLNKPRVGIDIANPSAPRAVWGCGQVVPVDELVESVHVLAFQDGGQIGEADAAGKWQPVGTSKLTAGHQVAARQIACPDLPTKTIKSPLSDPLTVSSAPSPLPTPSVQKSSLVVGNDAVVVEKLFVGAAIDITDHHVHIGGGLATASVNKGAVSPRLKATSSVQAAQELCEKSGFSNPETPSTTLPAPIIVPPVCRGSHYATIRNTIINANVVLFRNGFPAGYGGAVLGDLVLALGGGQTWDEGDEVTALQYIEDKGVITVISPVSAPVYVNCAPENVVTQHNDNARSGAYLVETHLTPANVRPTSFGRLYSRAVDGNITAQPLYLRAVRTSQGKKNLFFIATAKNKIYAFDADDLSLGSGPIWVRDLNRDREECLSSIEGICFETKPPFVGITSTPVIDAHTHTMYVVARCSNTVTDFIYAINTADGKDRVPRRKVEGTDPSNSSVKFNAHCQRNRPGLLLMNGVVYAGYATFSCDASCSATEPYHGWVLGFRASDLTPAGVFCTSGSGAGAGIWQSGNGLVGDTAGNIYFETGNDFDDRPAALGDAFVKLHASGGGLSLAGSFTPNNAPQLRHGDTDLGSGGPMLLPGGRLIGGGKQGRYYVLNTNTMKLTQNCDAPSGHCSSGVSHSSDGDGFQAYINTYHDNASKPLCPDLPPAAGCNEAGPPSDCFIPRSKYQNGELCGPNIHAGPVFWKGREPFGLIYKMAEKDRLKAFRYDLTTHHVAETPLLTATGSWSLAPPGMPGGFSSISASDRQNGIVWNLVAIANAQGDNQIGRLAAFDATTLVQIWVDTDDVLFAKFNSPTIADGKVIRATYSNQVIVYGLWKFWHRPFPFKWLLSINQKYEDYGSENGVLGKPTSDEKPIDDVAGGRYRDYRGPVFGLSGNMVSVRTPLDTELPTCSQPERGKPTDVESSIYWSPTTGAQVVQGEIRELWLKLGAEKGQLGYPIEDETRTPDGRGRMSRFQQGEIWWYPDKGPYVREAKPNPPAEKGKPARSRKAAGGIVKKNERSS